MSGHSKWSKVKNVKAGIDAKKGQFFTKMTREIMVAVREGGPNPDSNFRLRLAVQRSKDGAMPNENIERAIKKASGGMEATNLTELDMEGYGPGGIAIMVQALSDNRNRTIQEIRSAFNRHNGNLGENGCVGWMFESRGIITVPTASLNPDELELNAIDAGAQDVEAGDGYVDIYTKPQDMEKVRAALEAKKIPVQSAEVTLNAKNTVNLEEKTAFQALKLLNRLEEMDDVQSVSSNADFSDEIMQKFQLQQA